MRAYPGCSLSDFILGPHFHIIAPLEYFPSIHTRYKQIRGWLALTLSYNGLPKEVLSPTLFNIYTVHIIKNPSLIIK